jgi:hypothetical protein
MEHPPFVMAFVAFPLLANVILLVIFLQTACTPISTFGAYANTLAVAADAVFA